MTVLAQHRRRLFIGGIIGIFVVVAVVIISDAGALADALESFDWRLAPAIFGLTLLNYLLRWVKWHYYLHVIDVDTVTRRDSALIFSAGLTMALTPGKVGELLKSYLLRARTGIPMSRSAPVLVAERATDAIGLLILAFFGLIAFRNGWQILVASAIVIAMGLLVVQHDATMVRLLNRVGSMRAMKGRAASLELLYTNMRTLLRPRPLGMGIAIGVVSWFFECVAFYLILVGLDLPRSAELLLQATFVFTVSAWVGGLSLLPGGLGASEASVAGLLLLIVDDPGMTTSVAGAATLLVRFATLWFGVLIGVTALARVAHWVTDAEDDGATDDSGPRVEGMATGR
ncbi:MAG: TIGR00374 family protein [Chloroflexi bacterium]|nr:MAG: TIGR00374 family protein [Chloroflexota bacterium]